jgi:hypothetical protein
MFLLTITATFALGAPPPREDDALKIQRLFGEVIDPDGDCKFTLTGAKISITTPGTDHSLTFERGKTNAPRVVKEWDGDFRASVTVEANFPKSAKGVVMGRNPFHGAGLLVYASDKTYLQLQVARIQPADREPSFYASWELRIDGEWPRRGKATDGLLPHDKPVSLRIVRTGDRFDGSHSTDGGKTWTDLPAIQTTLPAKVKVGILAGHNSDAVFAPTFENLTVEKR